MKRAPQSLPRWPAVVLAAAFLWAVPAGAQKADPALAKNLFDLATRLEAEGKPDQALARYGDALAADPSGALADDALLAMAVLHHAVGDLADLGRGSAKGLATAAPLLRRVRDEYPRGNAAPEAVYRLALIGLDPKNPERNPDEAWADFAAVVSVYPESGFAGRALMASALVDEQLGRADSAMLSWFRLADEYPSSGLAARARLGLGRMLLATGRADLAIGELQAARNVAGDDATASAEALAFLTLAARLGALGDEDPSRVYRHDGVLGATQELKGVRDLTVRPSGEVLVVDRGGNAVAVVRADGTPGRSIVTSKPDAVTLSPQGDVWIAGAGQITGPFGGGDLLREDDRRFVASALAPAGSWGVYAIDADRRQVLRLGRRGGFRGVVPLPADTVPVDLAAAPGGSVLVLDGKGARVLELDESGKVRRIVGPTGPGWELRRPGAVDRDLAGNVYVLEPRTREVLVIRPDGSLLARVVSPKDGDGVFQKPVEIAVDRAGRLLILDARDRRVVRYR